MPTYVLNILELVDAPIPAREFAIFSKEDAFKQSTSDSLIYAVAQRAQLRFGKVQPLTSEPGCQVHVPILSQGQRIPGLILDIDRFGFSGPFDIMSSERVLEVRHTENQEPLFIRTPERLLFDARRRLLPDVVFGLPNLSVLSEYRLLYIGMAPERGSVSRLLDGHHKFAQILLEATSIEPRTDVRDELCILLFRVRDLTFIERNGIEPITNEQIDDVMRNLSRDYESPIRAAIKT